MAKKRRTHRNNKPMIFSPWNYKVLVLGLVLIIVGFTSMYLENEVEGFISLFVSPIVIMGGYITVIVSILKHDHKSSPVTEQS